MSKNEEYQKLVKKLLDDLWSMEVTGPALKYQFRAAVQLESLGMSLADNVEEEGKENETNT